MQLIVALFFILVSSTLAAQDIQVLEVRRLQFTMVTASDCAKCPEKLRVIRPWAEKAGYEFKNENHPVMRGGTYPRYRVCWGEYCEEFTSPVESLGEAVAQRLRKWGVAFKTVATRPAQAAKAMVKRRWLQNEGHYTPSVRGMSIEFHLTEHHGIDVTGMSVAEMEAAHQAAHR